MFTQSFFAWVLDLLSPNTFANISKYLQGSRIGDLHPISSRPPQQVRDLRHAGRTQLFAADPDSARFFGVGSNGGK